MTDPKPIEQKFLTFFGREQAYWTALGSLTVFNFALVIFGFSPAFFKDDTVIRNAEYAVGVFCAVVIVMMWLHAFNKAVWLTRWAYLVASFGTALSTILFLAGSGDNRFVLLGEIVVFLFLTTGGIVEISMHVEHGGRKQ